jgi:hypothetical protein
MKEYNKLVMKNFNQKNIVTSLIVKMNSDINLFDCNVNNVIQYLNDKNYYLLYYYISLLIRFNLTNTSDTKIFYYPEACRLISQYLIFMIHDEVYR